MRLQLVEAAHEHVEHALARRLIRHVVAQRLEHRAVDAARNGGEHVGDGIELVAQLGEAQACPAGHVVERDALERLLARGLPDTTLLTAFGPGFSCAGLLLDRA